MYIMALSKGVDALKETIAEGICLITSSASFQLLVSRTLIPTLSKSHGYGCEGWVLNLSKWI
jgi:hypothetical protein